jgi:hypothetical protein
MEFDGVPIAKLLIVLLLLPLYVLPTQMQVLCKCDVLMEFASVSRAADCAAAAAIFTAAAGTVQM